MLYNNGSSSAATLYKKKQVNIMLNNTESWSAYVFLSEQPARMLL